MRVVTLRYHYNSEYYAVRVNSIRPAVIVVATEAAVTVTYAATDCDTRLPRRARRQ